MPPDVVKFWGLGIILVECHSYIGMTALVSICPLPGSGLLKLWAVIQILALGFLPS